MGKMAGLKGSVAKGRRSVANRDYYKRQHDVTTRNKRRREDRRVALLAFSRTRQFAQLEDDINAAKKYFGSDHPSDWVSVGVLRTLGRRLRLRSREDAETYITNARANHASKVTRSGVV